MARVSGRAGSFISVEIFGRKTAAWIEPPFYFCYGTHISIGDGSYINMNGNIIDDGMITIGKNVMLGPAVTVATVGHPVNPGLRGYMYADPVRIGDNCWIGANVVTSDIPADSVAAGNPCRVIREIGERDEVYYYKERKIELPEEQQE